MKILLLDDLPDVMRLHAERLEKEGHNVTMLPDMTGTLRILQRQALAGTSFELLVLDLMLGRPESEFSQEQEKVFAALNKNQTCNIVSGQALGLRLWNASPRTPYCYLSAHSRLWVEGLDNEFAGATSQELALLCMEKDRVRSADMAQKLTEVINLWKRKGW